MAARYSLPVNLLCWGRLDQAKGLIARNFSTTIVIDHLGLPQPFEPPVPAQPWAELPKVLELAAYGNVRIKISGACTLSHEAFPYRDIWDPLARIFDAFGPSRSNSSGQACTHWTVLSLSSETILSLSCGTTPLASVIALN